VVQLGGFSEDVVRARAQEQYRNGRAKTEIEIGATALVVIDMLDEFVKPEWSPFWVPEATRQVPRIRGLIDAFHEADMPVIHLGYEVSLRGLNFPTTEWVVPIAEGFAGFEHDLFQRVSFYGPLQPDAQDLVILKHCYSGFHGTELDLVLRSLGVRTLVIAGTMSNYCCGATAREAFWHGYGVIFGSDVNSSDDDELHEAELRTLRRGFARIATAEEILSDLRARTATAAAPA
jgi:nicotinamidase-related amidase